MAWFGKSEEELQKIEEDLNKKDNELSLKESKLNNMEKRIKNKENKIIEKDNELAERDSSISLRELEAENGFVSQHKASFKDVIKTQLEQLTVRKSELESLEENINDRLKDVIHQEGSLTERERVIKEREIEAEAGFASKNKISLRELQNSEKNIKLLEESLKEKENSYQEKLMKYNQDFQALNDREEALSKSELERDTGYAEEREKLLKDLAKKRSDFNLEFENDKDKKIKDLQNELDEKHKSEKEKLEKNKENLLQQQIKLEEQLEEVEFDKKRLMAKEERFSKQEDEIEAKVEEGIKDRKKSFDVEIESLQNEGDRLRESISSTQSLLGSFDELKRRLGNEDPEKVLLKLTSNVEEIKNLKEQLLERPTREMTETVDMINSEKERLDIKCDELSDENIKLKKSASDQSILQMQIEDLARQNKSYSDRFESVSADNNRLTEDLKRIQASYEREADREERINDIKLPYFDKILPRSTSMINELSLLNIDEERPFTEMEWLENIRLSCEDYGLKFPKRIFYSFHTALKTSEWSPLTVLAGVSGTGKSELPRLYSHFGGINFLSLAVQPNWDSKESMLGFFNSIDNKFAAEPVLRVLAQSQEEQTKDYPEGLKDTMTLILLDEMNLAYVELYFAEFLSKLELRRGKKGEDVPALEIALGAGVPDMLLPLGRNILWTGTMNQDETTKSLSDKVLDRGMVLHFPRPKSFERRKQLKPLENQSALMSRKLWESWWVKESKFTDNQITPFKEFVEEINDYLANVGKALGHRVWQSIEYYMANHPEVQQALRDKDDNKIEQTMKIAFEDQLVLKVMPKLRGIETRGRSKTACLDKIRHLLDDKNYSIVDDFDRACEAGYGQFMWNSAKYLENSEETIDITENQKKNIKIDKKSKTINEDIHDKVQAKGKVTKLMQQNGKAIRYFACNVEEGVFKKGEDICIINQTKEIPSVVIEDIILVINKKSKKVEEVSVKNKQVLFGVNSKIKVEINDDIIIK